jgi:hypothetical protein
MQILFLVYVWWKNMGHLEGNYFYKFCNFKNTYDEH